MFRNDVVHLKRMSLMLKAWLRQKEQDFTLPGTCIDINMYTVVSMYLDTVSMSCSCVSVCVCVEYFS